MTNNLNNTNNKNSNNSKSKFPSELRLDLVSKDWVVIATGRARKPETFIKERRTKEAVSEKNCVFCKISTQKKPSLIFNKGKRVATVDGGNAPKKWTTIVIPNKYPAFTPSIELNRRLEYGSYEIMNAVGFHEVVVTKDHKKHLAQFSIEEVREVLDVYQSRYLSLMKKKFVNHISIFHNHGVEAGASIAHPHSQIITTPLIDSDLRNALTTSKKYFRTNKKCIYCRMSQWEMEKRDRIIFENKEFLAICPFASKVAFQIIITPKKHLSHFETATKEEKNQLAEAFRAALHKLHKALGDPAYNFYLHTAPCDGEKHDHYHWHWTILPKTSTWAGFEIGTQMEISTIEPEKAAEYLRKQ